MPAREYIRFTSDGMVEEIEEVVKGRTTLDKFYKELQSNGPNGFTTPIMPPGTICYSSEMYEDTGQKREVVIMFEPHSVRSIFYHKHRTDPNSAVEHYRIAMPHCVFRFEFRSGRLNYMNAAVVKARPTRTQDSVYRLEMPNINDMGSVCIQLLGEPGNISESCTKTLDSFFTGQPFSQDWTSYPPGVRGFPDWQERTLVNPRFILDKEWPRLGTMADFIERNGY
jgi:hypothetical protein